MDDVLDVSKKGSLSEREPMTLGAESLPLKTSSVESATFQSKDSLSNSLESQARPNTDKKHGQITAQRDAKGHWLPGSSPNPNGKPKGTTALSTKVRAALTKIALTNKEGEEKSYEELLVERILSKAIVDGDSSMITLLWAYLEGRPVERKSLTTSLGDDILQPNERIRKLASELERIQRGRIVSGDGDTPKLVGGTE